MSMNSQAAPADSRRRSVNRLTLAVNRLGVYVIVLLLAVLGILLAPGKFLTGRNLMAVVQAVSLLGITDRKSTRLNSSHRT